MSVYEILNGNELFEGELQAFLKYPNPAAIVFREHTDSEVLEFGLEELKAHFRLHRLVNYPFESS